MAVVVSRARVLPAFFLIGALAYPLVFHRLGDRELSSSHEARAAQDAQAMLLDRRWDLPQLFDRKVELQKPPLYYWLVAGAALARGRPVDGWAVRLPAALSGLGCALLLALIGARRGRRSAGACAGLMLLTALHFTWLARVGRIDLPLAFTTGLALTGFFLGRPQDDGVRGSRLWLLVGYVAAALGVLLKGPIGVVLPAAGVVAFLLMEKQLPAPWRPRACWSLARQLGLPWGLLVLAAISLPWFLWADAQTDGRLIEVFFWKHNVERGLGGGTLAAHPWWFYGPRFAFDFLPWSVLLPAAGWFCLRRGWWRQDPEMRFGFAWWLAVLFVLSCARFKRADYLLPAYPGAALFLGAVAERCYREMQARRLLAFGFGSLLAACVLGWLVYAGDVLADKGEGREVRRLAAEIRRRAPAPQLVLFFRTEAHALAFHVGRPIDTLLEWENLDIWAARPETYYVVMPAEYAGCWHDRLKRGRLEEVLRSTVLAGSTHRDPLVLLRTCPGTGPPAE